MFYNPPNLMATQFPSHISHYCPAQGSLTIPIGTVEEIS